MESDPTNEFREVERVLAEYRTLFSLLTSQGQAKPDMVAFSRLRPTLTPPDSHGHLPGIRVGDRFASRGELAILGLHTQILRGIWSPNKKSKDASKGAYAIVLSGGYADDADEGTSFWYTGEGGQDPSGTQVKDQTATGGNLALKNNHATQTPVRVFRGSKADGKIQYTYEGLYRVVEVKLMPSKGDGPLVFQFKMEGIAGESEATSKVSFKALSSSAGAGLGRNKLAIASDPDSSTGGSKAKKQCTSSNSQDISRKMRLEAIQRRPGLVVADISGGLEPNMPIPLFNEVDEDGGLDPRFEYICDNVWAPGVEEQVKEILETEASKLRQHAMHNVTRGCGIALNSLMRAADFEWIQRAKETAHLYEWAEKVSSLNPDQIVTPETCFYDEKGNLLTTEPCGVHECEGGPGCSTSECARNMQVSLGVKLPLEVFKTKGRGYGVRCAEDVPAGAFVSAYAGEVITESMVQELEEGEDLYLFSLDHFMHVFKEVHENGFDGVESELPAHRVPPQPSFPFPSSLMHARNHRNEEDTGGIGCGRSDAAESPSGQGGIAASAMATGTGVTCAGGAGDEAGGNHVLTPDPEITDFRPLLSIDATNKGNVARFINHSCDGNLAVQGVFAKGARSTVYFYIALFALEHIPAGDELTYDYGYHRQAGGRTSRGISCMCGAAKCNGYFL